MSRVALTRLVQLVALFVLIATLGFLLLHAAPGNPARLLAGLTASQQQVDALERQLGLNRPLYIQLFAWIGHLFTGRLGYSYGDGQAVSSILAEDAAPTIQLALSAFALIVIFGVPLGVRSALRPNRLLDNSVRTYTLAAIGVPGFVIGVLLVLVFGWLVPRAGIPYQGYVSIVSAPWQGFLHTLLPAVCLAVGPIAIVARQTRSSMLEVLSQEYITAARALGVSQREIIWRDALKNALLPVLTIIGLVVGLLFSGTVVIEDVFDIPGLGRQLVASFTQRDYPTAIGVMLVFATGFLILNFLTDMAYALVNPRVRRAYAART